MSRLRIYAVMRCLIQKSPLPVALTVLRGDACALERARLKPRGRKQACNLHRRPVAAAGSRDAALLQARCNGP